MSQHSPVSAGMPVQEAIVGMRSLTHVTEEAASADDAAPEMTPPRYSIVVTNEVDEYEKSATRFGTFDSLFASRAAPPVGDKFQGQNRKSAKLSVAAAAIEDFGDVKALIESLAAHETMTHHQPPLGPASDRVREEQRNVRVRGFLYAASRESDNDFHLIIGRDPRASPEVYMTMEVSGLPPSSSASFRALKAVRDAYKKFFGGSLPGFGYEFPRPPVPVVIEGSLFFDIAHAQGGRPGPQSLRDKMPTIWEVHPITKIVFEP